MNFAWPIKKHSPTINPMGRIAKVKNGFEQVTIQKEKAIIIPDDILINYLTADQIAAFKNGATGIFSVTVFAKKPMAEKCVPGGGCC